MNIQKGRNNEAQVRSPCKSVKRERSPSPSLGPSQRIITSGSVNVSPVPPQCVKGARNMHKERRFWMHRERRKLVNKGLNITRCFIRDDGMVLDWESRVPVWSDTLLPVDQAGPSRHETMMDDSIQNKAPKITRHGESSKSSQTGKPHKFELSMNSLKDDEARRLEDMAIEFLKRFVETFDTDRDALGSAYAPDASFSYCIHDTVAAGSIAAAFTSSADLRRFAPRKGSRNLLKAQTSRTLNQTRTQNPLVLHDTTTTSEIQDASVTTHSQLHRGPIAIVRALKTLGPHRFCARPPTELAWNAVALSLPGPALTMSAGKQSSIGSKRAYGDARGRSIAIETSRTEVSMHLTHKTERPIVFLTCTGELTELRGEREHNLSFDQTFILSIASGANYGSEPTNIARRSSNIGEIDNTSESDNNTRDSVWPMVALCHQLTVRDLSLRPPAPPLS